MAEEKARPEGNSVPMAPCVVGHVLLWCSYLGLQSALAMLAAVAAPAGGLWGGIGLLLGLGAAALGGWVAYQVYKLPDWNANAVPTAGLGRIGLVARLVLVALPVVAIAVLGLIGTFRGLAGKDAPGWLTGGEVILLTQALAGWLGAWLWRDFIKLPDWSLAPEVPLGMKLTGHLARVCGSIGVVVYAGLCVQAVAGSTTPRPGDAAFRVLMVFAMLLLRFVGSAIAEARRWARAGGPLVSGLFLVVFLLTLISSIVGGDGGGAIARAVGAVVVWAAVFVFLLGYFSLPRVAEAFKSHGL